MKPDFPHERVWVAFEAGKDRKEEICVLALGDETYRVLVPPL